MGNIVNRVFESAGPDGKVRGTPQQIIDKYEVLARDAQVAGDRVAAESYMQHAEHYTRLLSEAQRQFQENRQERDGRDDRQDRDDRDGRDETRGEDRGFGGRDEQPRRAPQPQVQAETTGLTTFGADEPAEAGPVETPESAAWRRSEPEAPAPSAEGEQPRALQVVEGERTEPQQPEVAAEGEQAAPPKRTRARRKKPVQQVAEASAE